MKINRRFKKNQDDYPRKKPWDLQETVAGIYQEESEASLEGILCEFEEDVAFQEGYCQEKMTKHRITHP